MGGLIKYCQKIESWGLVPINLQLYLVRVIHFLVHVFLSAYPSS